MVLGIWGGCLDGGEVDGDGGDEGEREEGDDVEEDEGGGSGEEFGEVGACPGWIDGHFCGGKGCERKDGIC